MKKLRIKTWALCVLFVAFSLLLMALCYKYGLFYPLMGNHGIEISRGIDILIVYECVRYLLVNIIDRGKDYMEKFDEEEEKRGKSRKTKK